MFIVMIKSKLNYILILIFFASLIVTLYQIHITKLRYKLLKLENEDNSNTSEESNLELKDVSIQTDVPTVGHETSQAVEGQVTEELNVLLEDLPLHVRANFWFMHDGAPAHFRRIARQYLDNTFPSIPSEVALKNKPDKQEIFFQEKDADDIVVLYNRVPKTGSTTFVGVAYDLCKKNKFHVLHVNITGNNHILSLLNQIKFVGNVTKWNSMKPALYHGHFAFLDFNKYGTFKPLYINLIRRPLERFVSYYYFVRYGDNYRPYLIRRKHGNTMSFDECVAKQLPDCDPNNMWLQIPFFCGHSANCWKPGSKWALNEAKKNMINNYFLVGVTEELDDFILVLEQTLPRLFKGATEHYLNSNRSHLRQTVQKDSPSEETVKKIKESLIWQMENELYEFTLEHFHFIKKTNLKNKLQHVIYEKIRPKN